MYLGAINAIQTPTLNWYGTFFLCVSVDIDECKENSEACGDGSATCNNIAGSYECTCKKKGFRYNHVARLCLDIDECKKSPCHKSMVCQNSQGSYLCDCKPHYKKDGNVCKGVSLINLSSY